MKIYNGWDFIIENFNTENWVVDFGNSGAKDIDGSKYPDFEYKKVDFILLLEFVSRRKIKVCTQTEISRRLSC